MRLGVNAKLNLCLSVVGRLGEKHLIDGLFVPVGIKDELCLEESDVTDVIYDDGRAYERDVALSAVNALQEAYGLGGMRISIKKGIPEGAGLGGSSADAGAICRLVRMVYGLDVDDGLMLKIGSDVPYFYRGEASRVSGLGEKISRVEIPRLYKAVIVPKGRVRTGECYRLYDEIGGEGGDTEEFIRELAAGRLPKPFNALRRAAERINPEIEYCIKLLEDVGFVCGMTGSGSATFGMENDLEAYKYKTRKLFERAPKMLDVYLEKE